MQQAVVVADTAPARGQLLPPTVNWHLEPRCNYTCKFCFATLQDIPGDEVVRDLQQLVAVSGGGGGPEGGADAGAPATPLPQTRVRACARPVGGRSLRCFEKLAQARSRSLGVSP